MSTVCGRPQGWGGPAHVDACGQGGGGSKRDFFVDVINGRPLNTQEPSSYLLQETNVAMVTVTIMLVVAIFYLTIVTSMQEIMIFMETRTLGQYNSGY